MIQVTVVSPERVLFNDTVDSVKVPGEKGAFEILSGHASLLSVLTKGRVQCRGEKPFSIEINGGFVEVNNNVVAVCVEV